MNSATRNSTRRILCSIVPFIIVLLLSTFVFGQPNVYETQTSFPITFTSSVETTSGNYELQDVTKTFSGTIDLYYGNGIQGEGGELIPNAEGCFVRFSGDDGTWFCITSIYSASAETNRNAKPSGSDPTRMVGTGRILIPVDGVLRQGPVYIDVKGTWKWDSSKETLLFNGKIGGGSTDFVFTGSFKSTFVFPLE